MTNREWLATLTDEEFAIWCSRGEHLNYDTFIAEHPTPRLHRILAEATSGEDWLLKWLKEERVEFKENL